MARLQIVGTADRGMVSELDFVVHRHDRDVPGVLWRPAGDAVAPVVLLGHGGSGHKRIERHARLATWFAARAGIASLAIDGPFHGDRAFAGDGPLGYQDRVAREGAMGVHDLMRGDWLDTLAAVDRAAWVDGQRVAFLGMSMGSRYGLSVCASLASRLRCAVIESSASPRYTSLPTSTAPEADPPTATTRRATDGDGDADAHDCHCGGASLRGRAGQVGVKGTHSAVLLG